MEWFWNGMYRDLYDKVKNIIKQEACIKFCDASKSLYLETDASSVGLADSLLQVRDGTNCGQDEVLDNTALHLQAKACPAWNSGIATWNGRSLEYFMDWKNSITIVLSKKSTYIQTTNH